MLNRKLVMIGCGNVGSACVFAIMQTGLFTKIALLDMNRDKAEGEAMDISHGIPYTRKCDIYAGSYNDVRDADVVIITAGSNQRGNESRLSLAKNNIAILSTIIPSIMSFGFDGIMLIVSNPVDVLTYKALELSGLPKERVFGSGTVLDTARLKMALGKRLSVDSRNIHAYIIGEHGDSEIPIWSSANVYGVSLDNFCSLRGFCDTKSETQKISTSVKNIAYEIITKKQATYYGIAMAVTRILEAVVNDEHAVLPVSTCLTGEYGIEDVCMSLPCIVGRSGIEAILPLSLTVEETALLKQSASAIKLTLEY